MIKKNIITIAVICAVLGLTGCGSSTVPDTAPQTDETAAAETGTTAETTSSPAVQTTSAVSASAETTTAAQTDAPAAATAGKPDCKPLAGSWRYQSDGRMQGSVKVTADGSFTYQPLDDSGAKTAKSPYPTRPSTTARRCICTTSTMTTAPAGFPSMCRRTGIPTRS